MSAVVMGIDPAKRSHAIEVIDERENTLVAAVFVNDNAGYRVEVGEQLVSPRVDSAGQPVQLGHVAVSAVHQPPVQPLGGVGAVAGAEDRP